MSNEVTEEVTIETPFEEEEPPIEQVSDNLNQSSAPARELNGEEIERFKKQASANEGSRQRMMDLAFALHERMEAKAKGEFFTKKEFQKRKKLSKIAKKSRKSHR